MNAVDFVNKVREMRATQKAWFKDHLRADLIKSKQLESEVDKALREGVTVYATATLEVTDSDDHPEQQIGLLDWVEPDAGDLLDTPATQRPIDEEGESK